MTLHDMLARLPRSLLATAALLALAPAATAEDDALAQYTLPESTVRLGLGRLSADNPRFGQYSGLRTQGGHTLLDVSLVQRDEDSGTWTRFTGRNLGLEGPEIRAERETQGDWGAFIDYNLIPRREAMTFNTGLAGIGTPNVVLSGTPVREVELDTRRDRLTLGLDKRLPGGLEVQLRYRTEEKSGARLFGRGSGVFLAEPLSSTTRQFEATLGYTGERLQVTGGYYGTAFTNRYSLLDVSTGTDIALAPDNESHQLFVSGGYTIAPGTRATFKVANGRSTQNERFYTAPDFPGNVQTSLNGRVDTSLVQVGITSRPVSRLTLLANLRYEDRDDKTPRYQFLTASTGRDGFNTPFSRTTKSGKLEAGYLLPVNLQLIGAVEVDKRQRSVLSIRQASWREENDETTYRLEARRGLSDTLNGSLAVLRSDRGGSDYLPANNNAAADFIDPIHFADRKRDKVRLSLDWVPVEALSLQLLLDDARDTYGGRPLGPERGTARFVSLDANYSVSDDWQLVGWVAGDDTRIEQTTITGANGTTILAQTWQARLRTRGEAIGVGVRGRPTGSLEVGGDLQHARDSNGYQIIATIPAGAVLPDVTTKRTTVRLFGQYELQSNVGLRLDVVHDRYRSNDWTWADWVYADGTTVTNPNPSSTLIGLTIVYRMR